MSRVSIMYGVYAGTWGRPGGRPHMFLYNRVDSLHRCLRTDGAGGAPVWQACDTQREEEISSDDFSAWLFHAAVPEAMPGVLVPATTMLGSCVSPGAFTNCTYVGLHGERLQTSHHGARELALGPAAEALLFRWACTPCPGHRLTPMFAVVCAAISCLALVPLAVVWHARRRRPMDREAWPAARRPAIIWTLFIFGWEALLLGCTPLILWVTGRWHQLGSVENSLGLSLIVLGFGSMQMSLRPDNSQACEPPTFCPSCCQSPAFPPSVLRRSPLPQNNKLIQRAPAGGPPDPAPVCTPLTVCTPPSDLPVPPLDSPLFSEPRQACRLCQSDVLRVGDRRGLCSD
jgi:hypothetical protein